jgi:hypothetical protein
MYMGAKMKASELNASCTLATNEPDVATLQLMFITLLLWLHTTLYNLKSSMYDLTVVFPRSERSRDLDAPKTFAERSRCTKDICQCSNAADPRRIIVIW